jgi:O-antigen/teichoic acid export membrane protein
MQFIFLSIVNISQPLIKIIVAYFLLVAGVGVLSPLVGIALSLFIPLVILYIYFFQKFKRKNNDGNVDQNQLKSELIKYSTASFLAGVGIAVLTNTDILLVRYFFDEVVSGQYAALSLMGKAIFYLIMPINFAFFPLIAYKRERKERLFHTVLLALGIVLLASVSLSFIYFAFPNLILKIFFPLPEYRVLAGYLGLFSLYIMMFSLATILFNFFLSIGRTEVYKISLIAAVAQVGAITFFHASLYQVIGSMFIVSLLFFIFLLGYYVKHERD